MKIQEPFVAPPFDPGKYGVKKIVFTWWSWSPDYPTWSKSCWSASSIDEALKILEKPNACELKYYHNKLIREGDGTFTEVYDLPFDPNKLKYEHQN